MYFKIRIMSTIGVAGFCGKQAVIWVILALIETKATKIEIA